MQQIYFENQLDWYIMRKLIVIVIGLGLSFSAYSQLESFDLSIYKLPDILTRRLDLSFDTNSHQSVFLQTVGNDLSSFRDFNLQGTGDITYSQFVNTTDYQGNLQLNINAWYVYRWWKSDQDLAKTRPQYKYELSLRSENRWYKSGGRFFEADITFSPRVEHFSSKSYRRSIFEIPVLWGKGRIEPVEDARLVIYILDDLRKNGNLKKLPTHDEIIQIAQRVSQLKKKRFFDHRLRRIYELRSMDSLFQHLGIVKDADIQYYTILTDNWGYSAGPPRWSGKRFSGGIISSFSNSNNNSSGLNNSGFFKFYFGDLFVGSTVRAVWENPLNLHWQRSISLNSTVYLSSIKTIGDSFKTKDNPLSPYLTVFADLAYGYYPNSRTRIKIMGGLYYYNGHPVYMASLIDNTGFAIATDLRCYTEYYFSPQLRLNLTYNVAYNLGRFINEKQNEENSFSVNRRFNQSLKASLLYSIF